MNVVFETIVKAFGDLVEKEDLELLKDPFTTLVVPPEDKEAEEDDDELPMVELTQDEIKERAAEKKREAHEFYMKVEYGVPEKKEKPAAQQEEEQKETEVQTQRICLNRIIKKPKVKKEEELIKDD